MDPVALTEALLGFDTTNPPGRELEAAIYAADILRAGGLTVAVDEFEPGRANVIASLPGDAPLVLTGHLDTVPVGAATWADPPIGPTKRDGKLYGRGASDMKSGVAVIICTALEIAAGPGSKRGLTVILTAGEEVGCVGAASMVNRGLTGLNASALLVAEPTSNQPGIGHKGAMYLRACTTGVTAHSSMPHLGVNAVYKAARAISKVESYTFQESHPLLGAPTINVGMVSGGMNVNSVPDAAMFTIDVRSVPGQSHAAVLNRLRATLGPDVEVEQFVDMPPVSSSPDCDFIACALNVLKQPELKTLSFFTDASVFQPAMNCPTLIFGPGEPSMAHQTDEFCYIGKIEESTRLMLQIARAWDARAGK